MYSIAALYVLFILNTMQVHKVKWCSATPTVVENCTLVFINRWNDKTVVLKELRPFYLVAQWIECWTIHAKQQRYTGKILSLVIGSPKIRVFKPGFHMVVNVSCRRDRLAVYLYDSYDTFMARLTTIWNQALP